MVVVIVVLTMMVGLSYCSPAVPVYVVLGRKVELALALVLALVPGFGPVSVPDPGLVLALVPDPVPGPESLLSPLHAVYLVKHDDCC